MELTATTPQAPTPALLALLCRELVRLARLEEDAAASEAAGAPYWASCPPSVAGRRAAARALRADAARLEAEARQPARSLT